MPKHEHINFQNINKDVYTSLDHMKDHTYINHQCARQKIFGLYKDGLHGSLYQMIGLHEAAELEIFGPQGRLFCLIGWEGKMFPPFFWSFPSARVM